MKTFSIGGVHPHGNKLSAGKPIVTAALPQKAYILLGQHIGAPAKPIVARGDEVKVGQKIAEPGEAGDVRRTCQRPHRPADAKGGVLGHGFVFKNQQFRKFSMNPGYKMV